MNVPRSVDTSNLSSVTSFRCPAQHKWSEDSLADFNNEWISLFSPLPLASSFTLISCFTSLWLLALSFTSTVSQISRSSVSWSAEAAVKKMHCDTFQKPGTVTLNQGLRRLQASYWPSMPVPEEPQNFDSLMGFVMPMGFHLVHGWEEKTKINHTSKDGVHQFGEKEKWPRPWLILGICQLRVLQDPCQTGFWSVSYLFVEDGKTV